MASIGIMIEGQEGLTWERFLRLATAVEDMGFASLFRSDHLVGLVGHHERETLALWPSLTALALKTERIRFGPMVSPMTFRHPVNVAKAAASVSQLSNGRLDLGLGAGWHDGEHEMFGLFYPPYSQRLLMLEEGTQVIKGLWTGEPFTFEGEYYNLRMAENHPHPQPPPPIIMGGKGDKTLGVVAKDADEWNFVYGDVAGYLAKAQVLEAHCQALGRDPSTIRRSVMNPVVIGKDPATVQNRIDANRAMFPHLPATLPEWQAAGYPAGSPEQIIASLKAFEAVGIERFMLQYNDLDDMRSLELLAKEVLPHFV